MTPPKDSGNAEWEIPDAERAKMRDAINAKAPTDPANLQAMIDQYGKRNVAEAWAAKRGTKVESQMRNISRYLKGERKMSAQVSETARDSARKMAADQIRSKGRLHASFTAKFETSPKKKWKGTATGELSGESLAAFAAAIEAGDDELAAQIIAGEYFGDPDIVSGIDGVTGMTWY